MHPGGWTVGAGLSQEDKGQEHVVACFTRQLSKAERNYATIEREALAVITAVKEFYPYLYGHTFRLITDHNALTTLTKLKDVGGRLARWIIYLQQFNCKFEYNPGPVIQTQLCFPGSQGMTQPRLTESWKY